MQLFSSLQKCLQCLIQTPQCHFHQQYNKVFITLLGCFTFTPHIVKIKVLCKLHCLKTVTFIWEFALVSALKHTGIKSKSFQETFHLILISRISPHKKMEAKEIKRSRGRATLCSCGLDTLISSLLVPRASSACSRQKESAAANSRAQCAKADVYYNRASK